MDLLHQVPCGILTFDDGGMILSVNDTLGRWLGFGKDDLKGRHIDNILTVASRIFYNTHFFPLIKLHGKAEEIFLTLAGHKNSHIPVLSTSVRKESENGWLNITAFMQVPHRKKFEEEILHARRQAENALKENKELEALSKQLEARSLELDRQYQKLVAMNEDIVQFSKIVSHDLQEPIRKIKLFANMLGTPGSASVTSRETAIQRIQASADRLGELTMGLQQYVQIDALKDTSPVDLNQVIDAAAGKVGQMRQVSNMKLNKESLPTVEGHPALLELLFYHLFDNSIKFRKPSVDPVIHITSTILDENIYRSLPEKYRFVEHVRIIFSDNGIGFDNQYSKYVFELIKKIDLTTHGLGIGLPLIKKIVDSHHGTVRIESEPGQGTRVFLVLPLASWAAGAVTHASNQQ